MRKSFFIASIIGFAAAYWFFRLPYSYGKKLSGYIIAILEDDNGDVIVKMNNDRENFIISNGIDLGIDVKLFQTKLIGKKTDLWITHPKWPIDNTPHINKLVSDGEVVYTKW